MKVIAYQQWVYKTQIDMTLFFHSNNDYKKTNFVPACRATCKSRDYHGSKDQ